MPAERLHHDDADIENTIDGITDKADIHPSSKQDVKLYIRTYSTMLRSSGEVKINALV